MEEKIKNLNLSFSKVILLCPFELNKTFKDKYDIKYNSESKYWFYNSLGKDDLPTELEKYKRVRLDLDKDNYLILKSRCKSLIFSKTDNCCYCSNEDYQSIEKYIVK